SPLSLHDALPIFNPCHAHHPKPKLLSDLQAACNPHHSCPLPATFGTTSRRTGRVPIVSCAELSCAATAANRCHSPERGGIFRSAGSLPQPQTCIQSTYRCPCNRRAAPQFPAGIFWLREEWRIASGVRRWMGRAHTSSPEAYVRFSDL